MDKLGQGSSPHIITEQCQSIASKITALEKRISGTILDKLSKEVDALFISYKQSGALEETARQTLEALPEKMQALAKKVSLYPEEKKALFFSIQKRIQEFTESLPPKTPITPVSTTAFSPEAFERINNIVDPSAKAQALIDMVQQGGICIFPSDIFSWEPEKLTPFIETLEKAKDLPEIQERLTSIPLTIADTQGIDTAMSCALTIKDLDLKKQAISSLLSRGGLAIHSFLEESKKLPETDRLSVFKIALELQIENFSSLIAEEEGIDTALKIALSIENPNSRKNAISSLLGSGGLSIFSFICHVEKKPNKDALLDEAIEGLSNKLSNPLSDEEILAISDYISALMGAKTPEEEQKQSSFTRTIRKGFSFITGMHNTFSKKAPANTPSPVDKTPSTPRTDSPATTVSSTSLESLSKAEETISAEETLAMHIGGQLFDVLHSTFAKQKISNITTQPGQVEGTDQVSFSLPKIAKKIIPANAIKNLLTTLGLTKVASMASKATIEVALPDKVTITRSFIPTPKIEFDPSSAVNLKIQGMIVKMARIPSSLYIREILLSEEGHIHVTFDTINKGAWANKESSINLKEASEASIPFWNEIWESPS
jgi:hypothetical protein